MEGTLDGHTSFHPSREGHRYLPFYGSSSGKKTEAQAKAGARGKDHRASVGNTRSVEEKRDFYNDPGRGLPPPPPECTYTQQRADSHPHAYTPVQAEPHKHTPPIYT